jgi:hypothetical protein
VDDYSRRDRRTGRSASTNAAEAKRSLDGTHPHVSAKHLPLYLELDYKRDTRKVTRGARTASGIKLIEGKRLMLRDPK